MFRFKQFDIAQERSPMKVGTDGVLLGAWAAVDESVRRILDVGTGTGVIALMMAQRTAGWNACITGVDIGDMDDAMENGTRSPWADRVRFVREPVQTFEDRDGFDLILSNPPFFVDSLLSPDGERSRVRHAVTLPYGELRDAVVRLLRPEGRFAVVLPVVEAARFSEMCRGVLSPLRCTAVRTTPRRAPKRMLMEFGHAASCDSAPVCDMLTVGTGEHETYTEEYRSLTRDFYLKF